MLSKVLAVTHSKVALAVLGAVLVGGGGSAVAVAATTGHLSTLGVNVASEHSNSPSSDSHAHTIGVEGLLTACSALTPPATITVNDGHKSWTFVVSATTKINGDTNADTSHNGGNSTGAGASSAKGDNSTHAGGASTGSASTGAGASSAKGDNSAHAGDNSAHTGGASSNAGDNSANAGDNSAHAAPTLADVCASANIGVRDVQVQATKNGSTYDAWKVTLQGPGSANGDGSSSGDSSSHGADSNGASSNGASSNGASSNASGD